MTLAPDKRTLPKGFVSMMKTLLMFLLVALGFWLAKLGGYIRN